MIQYRNHITREMLRLEPNTLFVFGDNLLRIGLKGQAKEMRGEPNAVGIPTKKFPSMREAAFFTDKDFDIWYMYAYYDYKKLYNHKVNNGLIVWPTQGIGTGLAQLSIRAPKIKHQIDRWEATL